MLTVGDFGVRAVYPLACRSMRRSIRSYSCADGFVDAGTCCSGGRLRKAPGTIVFNPSANQEFARVTDTGPAIFFGEAGFGVVR